MQLEADLVDATLAVMQVAEEHEREQEEENILSKLEEQFRAGMLGETDTIIAAYTQSLDEVS